MEQQDSHDSRVRHSRLAAANATDTIAASLLVVLSGDGRLPRFRDRSIRIVSTAVGSFGFEMELPALTPEQANQAQLFTNVEQDPHVQAVDAAMDLLREAATDDEDAISDLVAEMHPRAAKNRPAKLSFRVVSVRTRSRHILIRAQEPDEDPELQTTLP